MVVHQEKHLPQIRKTLRSWPRWCLVGHVDYSRRRPSSDRNRCPRWWTGSLRSPYGRQASRPFPTSGTWPPRRRCQWHPIVHSDRQLSHQTVVPNCSRRLHRIERSLSSFGKVHSAKVTSKYTYASSGLAMRELRGGRTQLGSKRQWTWVSGKYAHSNPSLMLASRCSPNSGSWPMILRMLDRRV
jgi:hypothetical protein